MGVAQQLIQFWIRCCSGHFKSNEMPVILPHPSAVNGSRIAEHLKLFLCMHAFSIQKFLLCNLIQVKSYDYFSLSCTLTHRMSSKRNAQVLVTSNCLKIHPLLNLINQTVGRRTQLYKINTVISSCTTATLHALMSNEVN